MAPVGEAAAQVVRRYYRHIDEGAYDALGEILAPDFVQYRPDRTIDGRETFVRFMREERPRTDTIHEISDLFQRVETRTDAPDRVAARGRLRSQAGEELFAFVDVHAVDGDGRIETLWTYTR